MIKISIYQNNKKILGGITNIEENKVKEIIDSERPITTTIDSSSTDAQIPSAKSVYTRTKGIIIVNSNINTYGTEILKYAVGRWIISNNSLAAQYSDLPVQSAGIMDIETITSSDEATPWDGAYSYRLYTFKTYDGGTYIRKIESSDVAGDIKDTGWQRVCTTKVADVAETTISLPSVSSEFSSGNIKFEVINGICYMSIINMTFANTPTGNLVVNIPGIPKRKFDGWHSISNMGSSKPLILNIGADGGTIMFYVDREAGKSHFGTFSYPVGE